jgi:hypothetical protein
VREIESEGLRKWRKMTNDRVVGRRPEEVREEWRKTETDDLVQILI